MQSGVFDEHQSAGRSSGWKEAMWLTIIQFNMRNEIC